MHVNKLTKLLALWLLLIFATAASVGQTKFLMLQKRNKNKNAYYKPGDVISFRVREDKSKITGEILDLKKDVIVFNCFEVSVRDITHLYIDEKTKWWLRFKVQQIAFIVGGGYLLLELINSRELSKDVVIVSGTLIGIGVLAKLLIGNKIRIEGRTRLRIIEM